MIRGAVAAAAAGMVGLLGPGAAGCGDNLNDPPAVEPADTLIIIAHFDDDMIFMQPELYSALASGRSLTTVYVSSGDQLHGGARAAHTFMAARMGYSSVTGSRDWSCGHVWLAGSPAEHCRLRDRPVAMIALGIADGEKFGELVYSPLHLVEGRVPDLPILGRIEGRATVASTIAELSEVIALTRPAEIHALDLASTHGYDHSGHLFSAAFALWAAADARYDGPIRWHRGYSVDPEPPTLSDADYAAVKPMIGSFEACYTRCGPCGTSCQTVNPDHDWRMHRQYSSTRSALAARGPLALDTGTCASMTAGGQVALADCAAAPPVELDAGGHLTIGRACLASGPGNDDPVAVEPCRDTPAQYWVLDSDGLIWNGRPPGPVPCAVDESSCRGKPPCCMNFDHVRCLGPGTTPGAPLAAPVCGSILQPHWRFVPQAAGGASPAMAPRGTPRTARWRTPARRAAAWSPTRRCSRRGTRARCARAGPA